jgi:hypothetical protein
VDKGRYLVEAHLREGRPVAELAAAHGVQLSWIYRLVARYRAEGDDDRARSLLLNMGIGQTCAMVAYSRELAERLGVGDEFRAREGFVTTPEARAEHGALGTTTAARTLRTELARRGWS